MKTPALFLFITFMALMFCFTTFWYMRKYRIEHENYLKAVYGAPMLKSVEIMGGEKE